MSLLYLPITAIINQRFTYDHASRILNTYHQIGDVPATEKLISTQSYNERDELATKTLGGGLQAIDYSYNIRKWLTMINDPSGLNADLFSQKLYYNAPPTTNNATFNATPQYNGNISFSEWRTGSSSGINGSTRNLAGYAYTYDGLNRLTAAKYSEYIGSYGSTVGNRYNVDNITYDKNACPPHLNQSTTGGAISRLCPAVGRSLPPCMAQSTISPIRMILIKSINLALSLMPVVAPKASDQEQPVVILMILTPARHL